MFSPAPKIDYCLNFTPSQRYLLVFFDRPWTVKLLVYRIDNVAINIWNPLIPTITISNSFTVLHSRTKDRTAREADSSTMTYLCQKSPEFHQRKTLILQCGRVVFTKEPQDFT
ncbi:hypothetical protein WAI453_002443 [Rhynchosporium graminicola]